MRCIHATRSPTHIAHLTTRSNRGLTYRFIHTEEELVGVREFFESPAGKAFMAKRALLTEKYVEVLDTILTEQLE